MFRVILIDDEPVVITVLRKAVNWEKYDCQVVGTAFDAKSGAAAVREHNPDIIFTDIRMPNEDGLSMLAGLKSEFPNMQVTILTGHREFEYAKRAIDLSATRFLLKPAKPAEIEEALGAMTKKLLERSPRRVEGAPMWTSAHGDVLKEGAPESIPMDSAQTTSLDTHHFVVNAAIRHMRQSCAEKLTLSDVADKIYVSQWHLSKLLSRYVGKNFYDLLNEARIEKAKELLQDPQFRISTISEMVGFADVSHFSRIFKKIENVTPKAYRNSLM
ncbi:MAG: response regulator [Peptococcaceae bacterium]|nr:response regulator [Peptococcaceae bacterium]